MVEFNTQPHLFNRKPRLISGLLPYQPNPYSDEEEIFSTRSSVDHNQASVRSKAEFTFRQPQNSEKHLPCTECAEMKLEIKNKQKTNLNEKSKLADNEKYLKQLKNLLDIKGNRLKEEETVLSAEKNLLASQKFEFAAFTKKKKQEVREELQKLNDEKKVVEAKGKELDSIMFEYKNNKKILKSSIKSKISEKFSLRETIILRSQQELVAKEENLRARCLEKEKWFKKFEEELLERKKKIDVVEGKLVEKQKILDEREEGLKLFELEKSDFGDYGKIIEEKEAEIQKLKQDVQAKDLILVELQGNNEENGKRREGIEDFNSEKPKREGRFRESADESMEKFNEFEKLMKELQRRLGKVSKKESDMDELEERLCKLEANLEDEKKEVNNKLCLVRELEKELEEKNRVHEQEKLVTEESMLKFQEALKMINEEKAQISKEEACLLAVSRKLVQKNLMLNYKEQLLSSKFLQVDVNKT